jgi:hypothetical protein
MKQLLFKIFLLTLAATSCKSVYSTTTIEANKSFVLGDNEHDEFEVILKNISKEDLELSQMPNGGTKQPLQVLKSKKSVSLKIDKNAALYIDNKSDSKVSVELVSLKSNSRLSMGYKD